MKNYEPIPGDKWYYGEKITNDWHRYLGPCPGCGTRTFDYGGGWRCMAMYCFYNASNPMSNVGDAPEWWKSDIHVYKDGSLWCAVGPDFINLQESDFAYGNTPDEAAKEFQKLN